MRIPDAPCEKDDAVECTGKRARALDGFLRFNPSWKLYHCPFCCHLHSCSCLLDTAMFRHGLFTTYLVPDIHSEFAVLGGTLGMSRDEQAKSCSTIGLVSAEGEANPFLTHSIPFHIAPYIRKTKESGAQMLFKLNWEASIVYGCQKDEERPSAMPEISTKLKMSSRACWDQDAGLYVETRLIFYLRLDYERSKEIDWILGGKDGKRALILCPHLMVTAADRLMLSDPDGTKRCAEPSLTLMNTLRQILKRANARGRGRRVSTHKCPHCPTDYQVWQPGNKVGIEVIRYFGDSMEMALTLGLHFTQVQ